MSTIEQSNPQERGKTNGTNMVGLEEIRAGLKKAAEGVKKAPGLMKSSVG